tara:strand:- start:728 stop:1303 length:576 start_codon:yes stop_codon:yes gene_type:complete
MNDTIERNYSIFSNIPHDLENHILSYLPNNDLDELSKMNVYLKNQVTSIKLKRKVIQLPPIGINVPLGRAMSFNGRNRVRARNRRVERILRSYPLIMDMIYNFGIREISPGIESSIFLSLFDRNTMRRMNNRLRRHSYHTSSRSRNQIRTLVREFINIIGHQDINPMDMDIDFDFDIDILQNNRRRFGTGI